MKTKFLCVLAFATVLHGNVSADNGAAPDAAHPTTHALTYSDYLHARGKDIVNRAGKVVWLRGVNIGGWLVTEGWMCGCGNILSWQRILATSRALIHCTKP